MPKNTELALVGEGVEPLSIPEIDKAISKYERKKEERCKASPGEIAAKQELFQVLHDHRDELPVNGEGFRFYRSDDTDYVLAEKLKRKKVSSGDDKDDD